MTTTQGGWIITGINEVEFSDSWGWVDIDASQGERTACVRAQYSMEEGRPALGDTEILWLEPNTDREVVVEHFGTGDELTEDQMVIVDDILTAADGSAELAAVFERRFRREG
ncbi:hypothetical protein [Radicibacter daui]|uniref:hypothetical protein n=1 Tax=Radicibacter daui TaxID=3064829 RepID=UPI004046DF8C